MRKKILIMSMFYLAAMTIKAEPVHQYEDSIIHQKTLASPSFSRHGKGQVNLLCSSGLTKTFSQESMLLSGNPTYLKNVSEAANWGRNWVIEAKGGASALPHFKPHITHS